MVAELGLDMFLLSENPAPDDYRYCGGTVLAGAVVFADHLGTAASSRGGQSRTRRITRGVLAVSGSVFTNHLEVQPLSPVQLGYLGLPTEGEFATECVG